MCRGPTYHPTHTHTHTQSHTHLLQRPLDVLADLHHLLNSGLERAKSRPHTLGGLRVCVVCACVCVRMRAHPHPCTHAIRSLREKCHVLPSSHSTHAYSKQRHSEQDVHSLPPGPWAQTPPAPPRRPSAPQGHPRPGRTSGLAAGVHVQRHGINHSSLCCCAEACMQGLRQVHHWMRDAPPTEVPHPSHLLLQQPGGHASCGIVEGTRMSGIRVR